MNTPRGEDRITGIERFGCGGFREIKETEDLGNKVGAFGVFPDFFCETEGFTKDMDQ